MREGRDHECHTASSISRHNQIHQPRHEYSLPRFIMELT
jgi:hypothetical protein